MLRRLLVLPLLYALLLCSAVAAQPATPLAAPAPEQMGLSIVAEADRSTIHIGDPIEYKVTISWDDSVQVQPPGPAADLAPFVIRDYAASEIDKRDGRNVLGLTYQLTIYEVGQFEIPPLQVSYTAADGSQRVLRAERIGVTVQSLDPKTDAGPRDLKPPVKVPIDWRPYLRWGLIVLAAMLLAAGLAYLIARRLRARSGAEPEERVPPYELAQRRLDELAGRPLERPEQRKLFVFDLSAALREYLEGRFEFNALELTTDELLERLPDVLEQPWCERLTGRLSAWDLVKFAKHDEPAAALTQDLALARELVETTKPLPEVEPEGEQPGEPEQQPAADKTEGGA